MATKNKTPYTYLASRVSPRTTNQKNRLIYRYQQELRKLRNQLILLKEIVNL